MPKTKNAYALRSFDATKILQRRWFKDFNLPVEDDEIFLNVFGKTIEEVTTVKNLEIITRLGNRTVFYEALLERYLTRLKIKRYRKAKPASVDTGGFLLYNFFCIHLQPLKGLSIK